MTATEPKEPRPDTLALLYQGIFTGIVRLQSGRQRLADPFVFRRRIRDALQDCQKDATVAGYSSREIRDAEFAVVAFLDEAVLSLKDPAREDWAKQTLSVELYGESNSGEVFFERLDDLKGQTESANLADVIEVYLLCLLLGFEGKYAGSTRPDATLISERLRSRIESIRGGDYSLSPPLRFPDAAPHPEVSTPTGQRWWIWPLAAVYASILLFVIFKTHLVIRLGDFAVPLRSLQ